MSFLILGVPGSTYLLTGPKSEGKLTILIYLVCSMLLLSFYFIQERSLPAPVDGIERPSV